jgi:heat shock protein HslJ
MPHQAQRIAILSRRFSTSLSQYDMLVSKKSTKLAGVPSMLRSLTIALALSACADESVSGFANPDAVYRLVEIDGAPFNATATIAFPEPGHAQGTAPCNQWTAAQTAPYPWISFGPIAATRRGCPDLDAEQAFLAALAEMTLAEIQGDTLILSTTDGREMVFRTEP